MVRIISPVSSFEGAVRVVSAGADELYCGVKLTGMKYISFTGRPAYCNLSSHEELEQVVKLAHNHGVTVTLAANLPFMADLIRKPVKDYLENAVSKNIDALIVGDLGALFMVRELGIEVPIYASSFLTIRNHEAVKFLQKFGVNRIIAPPDSTIDELKALVENSNGMEIEAFVHGQGCSNVNGNCYMFHSHRPPGEEFPVAPPKNVDESFVAIGTRNPCLSLFDVYEIDGDKPPVKIGPLHVLDAFAFCSLCYLPELIKTGINGFKIVGRCQPIEFQARTTKIYREFTTLIEKGETDLFYRKLEQLRNNTPELSAICRQRRCYYAPLFDIGGIVQ